MVSEKQPPVLFLHTRPRRLLEWREVEDGRCVVLRSKFGEGRVGRWLATRVGDSHYRIRLDELGTFVWKSCDGATSVRDIVQSMREHFGPNVEPAEQRVMVFIRKMVHSRLLELASSER